MDQNAFFSDMKMIARENKFTKTNLIYKGSSPSGLEELQRNPVVLNRGHVTLSTGRGTLDKKISLFRLPWKFWENSS